jgi:hypothetical protein
MELIFPLGHSWMEATSKARRAVCVNSAAPGVWGFAELLWQRSDEPQRSALHNRTFDIVETGDLSMSWNLSKSNRRGIPKYSKYDISDTE